MLGSNERDFSPFGWASDYQGALVPAHQIGCFKASAPGMFLPVIMDLYNGEAIALEEKDSFSNARSAAASHLYGAIALRAQVYDHRQRVCYELNSRR